MLRAAKSPSSSALRLPPSDCSAISIRKPVEAWVTCTPICRTSSGSRGSTRARRSCTCERARSRSVPLRNVTRICAVPLARLVEVMNRKSSTPLSSFSITEVTVRSTVCASAPTKVAAMLSEGGATSGYCSTGSEYSAMPPNSSANSATTHASTGR